MISAETESKIPNYSKRIYMFFKLRADERNIDINPITLDERTAKLTAKIFEEKSEGRSFVVCLSDDMEIDSFVKTTGVDMEIDRLTVLISPDESLFPKVWGAYVGWIHENIPKQKVLASLRP